MQPSDWTRPNGPGACWYPFAPRCVYATQESRERIPELRQIDGHDHMVACWNPVPDSDLPQHEIVEAEWEPS